MGSPKSMRARIRAPWPPTSASEDCHDHALSDRFPPAYRSALGRTQKLGQRRCAQLGKFRPAGRTAAHAGFGGGGTDRPLAPIRASSAFTAPPLLRFHPGRLRRACPDDHAVLSHRLAAAPTQWRFSPAKRQAHRSQSPLIPVPADRVPVLALKLPVTGFVRVGAGRARPPRHRAQAGGNITPQSNQ